MCAQSVHFTKLQLRDIICAFPGRIPFRNFIACSSTLKDIRIIRIASHLRSTLLMIGLTFFAWETIIKYTTWSARTMMADSLLIRAVGRASD
jgi:hypothetical protein